MQCRKKDEEQTAMQQWRENRLFHEVPIELFWYKTIKYKYNSNYKGKANAWQLWRSISEISKYVQDYIHFLRMLVEEKEILFLTTGIELPRERDAWYQWYMQYLNLNVWDFRGISATSLFHRISGRVWPVSSISPSEFYHKTYDYLCWSAKNTKDFYRHIHIVLPFLKCYSSVNYCSVILEIYK